MTLRFDHTTREQRVLFGAGLAVEHATAAIQELGAQRVLIVADPFATELCDELAARIPVVSRIHDVVQHVPAENAVAAVARGREEAADAIVAIGGGSAVGLAKIVARDVGLPIVAVPTTFAGSEATDVWGITERSADGAERKVNGADPKVLPRTVVYDAMLSASLPGRLALASGLNAVAHAVDSLWAPKADPINRAMGTEALRALVPGLRALRADADDMDARETVLYGAYLAAVAFASAGSGMHHKVCHALGGAFGLSHSEMHATVLPYVTAFNLPAAPDAADRIATAFGGDPSRAAETLRAFRDELGITGGLRALGLAEDSIPEAASIALPLVPPSNPRPVAERDLEDIIRAAWAGGPVEEQS